MAHRGMRIAKYILLALVVLLLGSIVHYTLPRHEVVRIVGVETRLESLGANRFFYASVPSGMADSATRDVRYIETLRPTGRERVFRNEDTGWGWPPYFKMNSADMQARARDLDSTGQDPRWVRITYYGVRSRMFSIYPNAVRLRPAEGPDESTFPLSRTVGIAGIAVVTLWLWWVLRRLRLRRLEPFAQATRARGRALRERLRGFFGRK